jgi:hypothetical protein
VLSGGFPEHDLREAGCVRIYRDPGDLLDRYDEVRRMITPALKTP